MDRPHDTATTLRTAAIALLVGALAFFGLASAAHSVHHLDADGDAGQCPMAFAAQHVEATPADLPQIDRPLPTAQPPAYSSFGALRSRPTFRPDEGRAPPPDPSA